MNRQRTQRNYRGMVAVVTGASSGIGRAIAITLADRDAIVVGVARRRDLLDELATELRKHSPESSVEVCDVSDAAAYRAVLAGIREQFGKIDILINNAGVDIMLYVSEADESIVREVFAVNFFSTVAGTLFVLPEMVQRGSGIIVNTSSDTARAPEPGQGAYAASKAAIAAFTESIAHETDATGVHLHVLYPGWVPTAMGLPDDDENGSLPPRLVRRTAEGVANLVAERMGGRRMEINAAWLPLLAPITRSIAPLAYQRAMKTHSGSD